MLGDFYMAEQTQMVIYDVGANLPKVEVVVDSETVWLSLNDLVDLFHSSKSNISEHLKHIFADGELSFDRCVRKFRTDVPGSRKYLVVHYNLDVVIALGYRVDSSIAVAFRKWATSTLHEYLQKGFVLNDGILKESGGGLYFKELLNRIRDIRASEKVLYRQVLEIYATSVDYDPKSPLTLAFFKEVQNKMHYAVTHETAAEIIYRRADSAKPYMGLTSFEGESPRKDEAEIAKNYLSKDEGEHLSLLVSFYLDYAELMAKEQHAMTMKDWSTKLDEFLSFSQKDILADAGTISHEEAIQKADSEYEKYSSKSFAELTDVEKEIRSKSVLPSKGKK
jgi:hypothetical protein